MIPNDRGLLFSALRFAVVCPGLFAKVQTFSNITW
jgi:hypothetical protein